MPHRPVSPIHRGRSRALRSDMTEAERRLWYRLCAHRFCDLSFRRQQPIGPHIVDFVCFERRLIIELDGGQHAAAEAKRDRVRDAWLHRQGFTVRRYRNNDVFQKFNGVLEDILTAVEQLPPSLTLPRKGGGDRSESGESAE